MPKGKQGFQKGHPDFSIDWNKKQKGMHHSVSTEFKKGNKPIAPFKKGQKGYWAGKKPLPQMGFQKGHKLGWKNALTKLQKNEKIAGRKKPTQCEVCGGLSRISFDHNHETGEFRGWICMRCNLILGQAKDRVEILQLLIKYLRRNK